MYKYLVRINTPEELEVFAKHYNKRPVDMRDVPRLYYISTDERLVGSDRLQWEANPHFAGRDLPIYTFEEWQALDLQPEYTEAATKLTQLEQAKLQLIDFPQIKFIE